MLDEQMAQAQHNSEKNKGIRVLSKRIHAKSGEEQEAAASTGRSESPDAQGALSEMDFHCDLPLKKTW